MTKDFGVMLKSIVNHEPGTYTICDINANGIKSIETQMNDKHLYDLWIKTNSTTYATKDLPVEDVLVAFISVCKSQKIPAFAMK